MQLGIFDRPTLAQVNGEIPYYKEISYMSNDLLDSTKFHKYN
jgi:hypothetical protein